MNDATEVDMKAYADAMAQALGLPLTAEYAPQVEANLAVAFRLVLGRKEDRREAAAIGEAKEEAPVVVRSKIERILVNLTQTFEPFCFVPIDVSLDARLAF